MRHESTLPGHEPILAALAVLYALRLAAGGGGNRECVKLS
jgi:hypothetical protein